MTLARCLEVLRYNQQHPGDQKVIPYRESKVGVLLLLLAGMRSDDGLGAEWHAHRGQCHLMRVCPGGATPTHPHTRTRPPCARRSRTCSRTSCTATAAL